MEKIRRFRNKLNNIESKVSSNEILLQDTYALKVLAPILNIGSYLPFNGGALRPIAISFLLNEILINKRRTILEFGSGLSTIMIARLIKQYDLDANLISIEHDKEWVDYLLKIIEKEETGKHVQIVYAPLKDIEHELGKTLWYSISDDVFNTKLFDMVIIDGPPAFRPENQYSRYPAMDSCNKFLSDNCFIFLDDTNRNGEKKIIEIWEKKYNLKFASDFHGFSYVQDLNMFNAIPFKYRT